jgi:PAS domain-containing protein
VQRDDVPSVIGWECARFSWLGAIHRIVSAAPLLDEDPSIRREQLLALLQASPAQFTLHRGPDHVFVMNNAAHQHLTGGRKLVGVPFAEAMPELVAQGILAHLDAVYATGEAWRATPLRVFLTGSAGLEERWFDLAILPVHDDAGHIEGVATICSDVTDLVRTRRELGVMSARMMQLWESNVLGICDTDAEQNVVDANERPRARSRRGASSASAAPPSSTSCAAMADACRRSSGARGPTPMARRCATSSTAARSDARRSGSRSCTGSRWRRLARTRPRRSAASSSSICANGLECQAPSSTCASTAR